jgi:hypothetical protein
MSCVHLTPEMEWLLSALRTWPVGAEVLDTLRATPEWAQARVWGWIMESGELTGSGWRHAGSLPGGILPDPMTPL